MALELRPPEPSSRIAKHSPTRASTSRARLVRKSASLSKRVKCTGVAAVEHRRLAGSDQRSRAESAGRQSIGCLKCEPFGSCVSPLAKSDLRLGEIKNRRVHMRVRSQTPANERWSASVPREEDRRAQLPGAQARGCGAMDSRDQVEGSIPSPACRKSSDCANCKLVVLGPTSGFRASPARTPGGVGAPRPPARSRSDCADPGRLLEHLVRASAKDLPKQVDRESGEQRKACQADLRGIAKPLVQLLGEVVIERRREFSRWHVDLAGERCEAEHRRPALSAKN